MDKIAEIQSALERATPGQWKGKHAIKPYITVFTGVADEVIATVEMRNNLQLLSNASEWLVYLLSELDRKDEEIKRMYGANQLIATENAELQAEIQKLREELEQTKLLKVHFRDRKTILQEQLQSAQQENERLKDGLRKYTKELDDSYKESITKWKKDADMFEQGSAAAYDISDSMLRVHFGSILKEIGITP